MISVFIASSGRPEMFANMLKSLRETTEGYELEVVVVIDADYQAYLYAYEYEVNVIDYSHKRRGALWAWNRALQLSQGEYLIPAGDDQIFHEGWLEYALDAHRTHCKGYGVVGMNDLAYDGNTQVSTMFLYDRRWVKDRMGGVFAPPMYHYFCIDSEINEKAKMFGEFYWEHRSIVEHLHVAHGKRPLDDLDREKMDAGWMELDNRTFEDRKSRGFPVTWQSLI